MQIVLSNFHVACIFASVLIQLVVNETSNNTLEIQQFFRNSVPFTYQGQFASLLLSAEIIVHIKTHLNREVVSRKMLLLNVLFFYVIF